MIYLLKIFHMNAKTKGFLYTLLIGAVLVPVVYLTGVNADDTTCYQVTGNTSADYYQNSGVLDFDNPNSNVCVDADGNVTGGVWDENIGMIYFDEGGDSVVIDEEGNWIGSAYAPLGGDQGTFFRLDNVVTDLETGLVSGHADSTNLGELSFEGVYQTLSPVEVGVYFHVEPFEDTRVADGYPVADGGGSGYRLVARVNFSEVPFDVDLDEFNFTGTVLVADGSDLRLDQLDGLGGGSNNAVNADSTFTLESYVGEIVATYYLDISSYAPTSDAYCGDISGLEKCTSPLASYTYGIDGVEVSGSLPREFVWANMVTDDGGMTFSYESDLVTVAGVATSTDVAQNLPFAPIYEIDNFGVTNSYGIVIVNADEVPTLAEGVSYGFGGTVVQNGGSSADANLTVQYSITDINYDFGKGVDCIEDNIDIGSVLDGDILAESGIGLCPSDELASLDPTVDAKAETAFALTFDDGTVASYPSEYFSFSDTRAEISENPRVYVIGTVSGLAESDDVTVVGNMGRLELRDALFEQITKVTKNVDAVSISGGGSVNSAWERSGGGTELSGGNVLYFVGDDPAMPIEIEGGPVTDGMHKTIVVVGTNVWISGSIYKEGSTTGELGIVVLADADGHGGDLYIDADVTDLHANIFLDGSLLRADETGDVYEAVDSTAQLYILGSIVSKNTIEGYEEGTSCVCGDGTECDESLTDECTADQAMIEDLQYTSYFRVCCTEEPCVYTERYGIRTLESPYEECSGYEKSDYAGEDWRYPVIIEYSHPSSNMPIFSGGGSSVGE